MAEQEIIGHISFDISHLSFRILALIFILDDDSVVTISEQRYISAAK